VDEEVNEVAKALAVEVVVLRAPSAPMRRPITKGTRTGASIITTYRIMMNEKKNDVGIL
jgi:hypothetical protein